jgi:hypothetical protein
MLENGVVDLGFNPNLPRRSVKQFNAALAVEGMLAIHAALP